MPGSGRCPLGSGGGEDGAGYGCGYGLGCRGDGGFQRFASRANGANGAKKATSDYVNTVGGAVNQTSRGFVLAPVRSHLTTSAPVPQTTDTAHTFTFELLEPLNRVTDVAALTSPIQPPLTTTVRDFVRKTIPPERHHSDKRTEALRNLCLKTLRKVELCFL